MKNQKNKVNSINKQSNVKNTTKTNTKENTSDINKMLQQQYSDFQLLHSQFDLFREDYNFCYCDEAECINSCKYHHIERPGRVQNTHINFKDKFSSNSSVKINELSFDQNKTFIPEILSKINKIFLEYGSEDPNYTQKTLENLNIQFVYNQGSKQQIKQIHYPVEDKYKCLEESGLAKLKTKNDTQFQQLQSMDNQDQKLMYPKNIEVNKIYQQDPNEFESLDLKIEDSEETKESKTDKSFFNKGDCQQNQFTYLASVHCSKIVMDACDQIAQGNATSSICNVRPPGHHAYGANQNAGFCFINNVVVAAQHLIDTHKYKRILIFDWDVHHGDGTQNLTQGTDNILFVSLHRQDDRSFYPNGKGHYSNVGNKKGRGYNINVPWNTFDKTDKKKKEYLTDMDREINELTDLYESNISDPHQLFIWDKFLKEIVKSQDPEFILVSCGFDSHQGDPLGAIGLTPFGYVAMLTELTKIQSKVCVVLEGGQNIWNLKFGTENLAQALIGHLEKVFFNQDQEDINKKFLFSKQGSSNEFINYCVNWVQKKDILINKNIIALCAQLMKVFKEFWPCINVQLNDKCNQLIKIQFEKIEDTDLEEPEKGGCKLI